MPYSDDDERYDAEFNQMTGGFSPDPHPYGQPAANATPSGPVGPKKTGLNTKGKAVLGGAGVLLAAGGFLIYQDHSANIAAQNAKQAEIALQQQRLELERLKVTNQVDEKHAKQQKTETKQIQQKIDACVDANRDTSAYLQGTVDACRDQYATTSADGHDMQEAGSSSTGLNTDGSISPVWLIGAAAGGVMVFWAARRGRRNNAGTPGGYVVVPASHQ